jgi:hypothetical protein
MLNKKGEHAGVAMYGGKTMTYAYCDDNGPKIATLEPLLQGQAGIELPAPSFQSSNCYDTRSDQATV